MFILHVYFFSILTYLLLNKTQHVSNYNTTEIIAKIDSNSGRTMWAKAIAIESQSSSAVIKSIKLIDDYAWVSLHLNVFNFMQILMKTQVATFTFYGLILKVDQAGNNVFIKTLSSNPGLDQTAALKYLQIHNIVEVSSNNIVMNGLINYYFSLIGYSENSYIDQIVFSLSANGSTQWASVFDYNLAYDSDGKMAYYDSIVYSALFAGTLYP